MRIMPHVTRFLSLIGATSLAAKFQPSPRIDKFTISTPRFVNQRDGEFLQLLLKPESPKPAKRVSFAPVATAPRVVPNYAVASPRAWRHYNGANAAPPTFRYETPRAWELKGGVMVPVPTKDLTTRVIWSDEE